MRLQVGKFGAGAFENRSLHIEFLAGHEIKFAQLCLQNRPEVALKIPSESAQ